MRAQQENLNPTPEAILAMIVWGNEYSNQRGGSMDFYDRLSPSRQEILKEWVGRVQRESPQTKAKLSDKSNVQSKVVESLNGYQVVLSIDHQSFKLEEKEAELGMSAKQRAEWYKKQLDVALKRMAESGISLT